MNRIKIFTETDRLTVATILVKNGYTVRQGKEPIPGKKSYCYFVEFEETSKGKGGGDSES